MKLVIIPVDGAVYVDGMSYSDLDLSMCPPDVHALQWKDTSGWIEFIDNPDGTKPQNKPITELPSWALEAKNTWDKVKADEEAAKEAAKIPVTVTEGNNNGSSTN